MDAARQRMYHGILTADAVADQLAARFNDRQHRTAIQTGDGTSLVQIGSLHGTPVTIHIADTAGGVLITIGRDRNWLDQVADASDIVERASRGSLVSLLTSIPDVIGELGQENLAPHIWEVIDELCALSRSLAGEKNAPANPKVCPYCGVSNPPQLDHCQACGGQLPVDLPRVCPKCGRGHTSDALFCQACGTRLVKET